MNKIEFVGRFTKDPEMSVTPSGINYVKYSIACTSRQRGEDGEKHTDFFPCISWREQANIICQYCKKGSLVQIFGDMTSSSYENEGKKSTYWSVNVSDIEFMSSNSEGQVSAPKELKPIEEDDDLPF